jgi:hypothetical protein
VLLNDARGETGPEARAHAVHPVVELRLAGWGASLDAPGIDWSAVPVASRPRHRARRRSHRRRAPAREATIRKLDEPPREPSRRRTRRALALTLQWAAHRLDPYVTVAPRKVTAEG